MLLQSQDGSEKSDKSAASERQSLFRRIMPVSSGTAVPGSVDESTINANENPQLPKRRVRIRRRRRAHRDDEDDANKDGDEANSSAQNASKAVKVKQHDAPLTKRDLYFCLRCGFIQVAVSAVSDIDASDIERQRSYEKENPFPEQEIVARVCLINWNNMVVLDVFVIPQPLSLTQRNQGGNNDEADASLFSVTDVLDYRTDVTGVTAGNLENTERTMSMDQVRQRLKRQIKGRILVGHTLHQQLRAMGLTHPWRDTRDTAYYAPFMSIISPSISYHPMSSAPVPLAAQHVPVELRTLLKNVLGWNVVTGGLVGEAIGCLDLYKLTREDWECELSMQLSQRNSDNRNTPAPGGQTASRRHQNYHNDAGAKPTFFSGTGLSPSPRMIQVVSSGGHASIYENYTGYDLSCGMASPLQNPRQLSLAPTMNDAVGLDAATTFAYPADSVVGLQTKHSPSGVTTSTSKWVDSLPKPEPSHDSSTWIKHQTHHTVEKIQPVTIQADSVRMSIDGDGWSSCGSDDEDDTKQTRSLFGRGYNPSRHLPSDLLDDEAEGTKQPLDICTIGAKFEALTCEKASVSSLLVDSSSTVLRATSASPECVRQRDTQSKYWVRPGVESRQGFDFASSLDKLEEEAAPSLSPCALTNTFSHLALAHGAQNHEETKPPPSDIPDDSGGGADEATTTGNLVSRELSRAVENANTPPKSLLPLPSGKGKVGGWSGQKDALLRLRHLPSDQLGGLDDENKVAESAVQFDVGVRDEHRDAQSKYGVRPGFKSRHGFSYIPGGDRSEEESLPPSPPIISSASTHTHSLTSTMQTHEESLPLRSDLLDDSDIGGTATPSSVAGQETSCSTDCAAKKPKLSRPLPPGAGRFGGWKGQKDVLLRLRILPSHQLEGLGDAPATESPLQPDVLDGQNRQSYTSQMDSDAAPSPRSIGSVKPYGGQSKYGVRPGFKSRLGFSYIPGVQEQIEAPTSTSSNTHIQHDEATRNAKTAQSEESDEA